jgi:hypothetical protein
MLLHIAAIIYQTWHPLLDLPRPSGLQRGQQGKCESKRLTWDKARTATQLRNTGDKDGRSKKKGHNKVSSQNDSNPDPNIVSSTVRAPDSGAENTTKIDQKQEKGCYTCYIRLYT